MSLEGGATSADHGTATVDGSDVQLSGTLTFAAGESAKTITIPVLRDDESPEDGEGITVTLSNASDGTIDTASTTADITNVVAPTIEAPDEANSFIGQSTEIEGLSFDDADDNAGFTVTLAADGQSQISIGTSGSASLRDGDENSLQDGETANTVAISGTQSAVNDALATLEYASNSTEPTSETLSVTVEDPNGNTTTDDVTINVGDNPEFTSASDDDLTGTSGNDLFTVENGNAGNFEASDQADGAGGTDRLQLDGIAGNLAAADLTSIEEAYLTIDDKAADETLTIDGDNFDNDLEIVRFTTQDGNGEADDGDSLTANDLQNEGTVQLTNDIDTVTLSVANDGTGNQSINLQLRGGVDVTTDVTAPDNDTETLVIESSDQNDAATKNTINNIADGTFSSVTVSGDTDLDIDSVSGGANFETLDASGFTGDLTVDLSDAANAVTMTGGEGNDTITASGNDDTIEGGAGADDITAAGGTETFVYAEGASGSSSGERDTITGLRDGDKIDVTELGTFGLEDGDTLTKNAGSLAANGDLDIFVDTDNERLVYETSDDGSEVTREEINIGNTAGASFTYNDNDGTVGNDDGFIEVGPAPLATSNNETGTLTVEGSAQSQVSVGVDTNAPTVNNTSVGTGSVTEVDASGILTNAASVGLDAPSTSAGSENTLDFAKFTGSEQTGDVLAIVTDGAAGDEFGQDSGIVLSGVENIDLASTGTKASTVNIDAASLATVTNVGQTKAATQTLLAKGTSGVDEVDLTGLTEDTSANLAFDNGVANDTLRIELGDDKDTLDVSDSDETIVGGSGEDTINLDTNSADDVVLNDFNTADIVNDFDGNTNDEFYVDLDTATTGAAANGVGTGASGPILSNSKSKAVFLTDTGAGDAGSESATVTAMTFGNATIGNASGGSIGSLFTGSTIGKVKSAIEGLQNSNNTNTQLLAFGYSTTGSVNDLYLFKVNDPDLNGSTDLNITATFTIAQDVAKSNFDAADLFVF